MPEKRRYKSNNKWYTYDQCLKICKGDKKLADREWTKNHYTPKEEAELKRDKLDAKNEELAAEKLRRQGRNWDGSKKNGTHFDDDFGEGTRKGGCAVM